MLEKAFKHVIVILMISLLSYFPIVLLINYLSQLPSLKYLFCDYMISGGSILFPWLSSFEIFEFTSKIGPNINFSLGNLLDIIVFYVALFNINGIFFRFYTRIKYSDESNSLFSGINFFYYYQINHTKSNKEDFKQEFLNHQDYEPLLIFKNKFLFSELYRHFKNIYFWKNLKFIRTRSWIKLHPPHESYKKHIFSNLSLLFFSDFIILYSIVLLWLKFRSYFFNNKPYLITNQNNREILVIMNFIINFSHSHIIFIPNIKFFSQLSKKYYKNQAHTIINDQNDLLSDLEKFFVYLCEILFLVRNDFFMISRKRIQTINLNKKYKMRYIFDRNNL